MNATEMSPKAKARFNRIKIVSQIFKVSCCVGAWFFGLCALLEILRWATMGAVMDDLANPLFAPQYHTLENIWLVGGCATFGLLAWFGFKLFRLYERGQLFSPETIGYLRKIAWVSLLLAIETAFSYALQNPNHPQAQISALGAFATLAFPGFLIFFFAWVMDEGRKIQEEQELTV